MCLAVLGRQPIGQGIAAIMLSPSDGRMIGNVDRQLIEDTIPDGSEQDFRFCASIHSASVMNADQWAGSLLQLWSTISCRIAAIKNYFGIRATGKRWRNDVMTERLAAGSDRRGGWGMDSSGPYKP